MLHFKDDFKYYFCLTMHMGCRLLVGIVTYFVAGALIMKFHYQSTGTDIIPNKALWVSLPFLIKVITI